MLCKEPSRLPQRKLLQDGVFYALNNTWIFDGFSKSLFDLERNQWMVLWPSEVVLIA